MDTEIALNYDTKWLKKISILYLSVKTKSMSKNFKKYEIT